MDSKTRAPAGWYDGKLADASTKDMADGSVILELEFDVGSEYFWVKEGVFVVNMPSGDAATDTKRAEWLKDSIERLKEAFPAACVDGKLVITRLTMKNEEVMATPVRVKVSDDGKYSKAKVFAAREKKAKISKEEALKTLVRHSRDLAKFGIAVEEPAGAVVAGSAEAEAESIPF